MKKSLKIFLPILIVALLLFCAYLFLFVIRTDVTADFYLRRGDRSMERGRYSSAIKSYRTAYELDSSSAETAVKLAGAYAKSGNYTKAEYTLVLAKSENPDELSLYVELSRVYVMQDKLLDAQRMLDQVGNAAIVSQLNALRPSAPSCTPEAGFYDDYITVSLSAENSVIYYTTDGSYPTKANGAYAEPFTLDGGESHVWAIAVNDDGLVSTLACYDFTVSGVIEPVTLSDAALDSYVRELLHKDAGAQLLTSDLWTIEALTVPESVQSLDDLQYFTGLRTLTVSDDCGSDFAFLALLNQLNSLNLSGCTLYAEALSQIGAVTTLTALDLSGCGLSTVAALSELTALESLNLYDNSIADLTPLTNMTALRELNLSRNAVTSVAPLGGMTELEELDISYNSISGADTLAVCKALQTLNISSNRISSVAFVSGMESLTHFYAAKNEISGVSELLTCKLLERLDLSNNQLTTIDGVQNLLQLSYLDVSHNAITAVPQFSASARLSQFYASYNALSDIEGLAGLGYLNYVDVDYNEAVTDILCLTRCANLVQVNAFGTAVSDVRDLTDRGVIVNYDPSQQD